MAEKPKPEPAAPALTESVPSMQGIVSAIASGNAPVIFFDSIPNFGTYNGIVHLTLSTLRFFPNPTGPVAPDNVLTANLRMNLAAFATLKEAVAQIDLMLARPENQSVN